MISPFGPLRTWLVVKCSSSTTFTRPARAPSAASALSRAGATVAAIVVVARRVNPDYKPGVQAMWNRQAPIPFSFKAAPWWADRD